MADSKGVRLHAGRGRGPSGSATVSRLVETPLPPAATAGEVVAGRYELLNVIGRGGMGRVFRALDRLTGRVVTIKRLHGEPSRSSIVVDSGPDEIRRALAEEFRMLAALRHPNIVAALDYGLDGDGWPFFTMDLEENARTIVEAGAGQPLAVQVDLLAQLLRALVYLHRHGIIHRDLKPENVLVVQNQVKLLDLGLSVVRDRMSDSGEWVGTLAYMSPEAINGYPVDQRSDLYSVGLIAYELWVGRYPFAGPDAAKRRMREPLPLDDDILDPRLRPLLRFLLEREPAARVPTAEQVLADLAAAVGLPLPVETIATRESFLQAAPFVGREEELQRLTASVTHLGELSGGTWLVGGESGIGKSRLLDELRVHALVSGVPVVRGQGVSDGASPYHAWREVLRSLIVRIDLDDRTAATLEPVIPDVSALIERPLPDTAAAEPGAAQAGIFLAVEEVFRRHAAPVVVLLEDLQWVENETMALFAVVARLAERLPILLVGSFRSDESPQLPSLVPNARVIQLPRFLPAETERFGELMIGTTARRPDMSALLAQESEGIPFFVVEVVRSLAEARGGLTALAAGGVPRHVASGGMQRFVRRRLGRVSPPALGLLRTAALIGRVVDRHLLGALHPGQPVDAWLAESATACVIESTDQEWRFAHDKLREQLVDDLAPADRLTLHRRIAEAIEAAPGDQRDRTTTLAHHWREAGDEDREAHYADLAGCLALAQGAGHAAVRHFSRCAELLAAAPGETRSAHRAWQRALPWRSRWFDPNARVDAQGTSARRGRIAALLSEAHYQAGEIERSHDQARRALEFFGIRLPRTRLGWLADIARQLGTQLGQVALRVAPSDAAAAQAVALHGIRAEHHLCETSMYLMAPWPMVWAALGLLNRCRLANAPSELAYSYVPLATLIGMVPLPRVAERINRRALETAERHGPPRNLAHVLSRIAVYQLATARWDQVDTGVARARSLAEDAGDVRLHLECCQLLGASAMYSARYEPGLELFRTSLDLSVRSGNSRGELSALLAQGDLSSRLGRLSEAVAFYLRARSLIEQDECSENLWLNGMLALARLRRGESDLAVRNALQALSLFAGRPQVVYWTLQAISATAEVLLTQAASPDAAPAEQVRLRSAARTACDSLTSFGRHLPFGRPAAHLWRGVADWQQGMPEGAFRRWRRCIAVGESLQMPLEVARAHLEIARHLPPTDAERTLKLHEAARRFGRLGCEYELTWAQQLLEDDAAPTREARP